jgi:cobalt-precorrin-7 (C5)-methyltransferase
MAVDPPILIVSCGPGASEYVTPLARQGVQDAEVLVGTPRLFELFPESAAERVVVGAKISEVLETIAQRRSKQIAVLVTGDAGLSSLAQPVIRRFGLAACRVIPGISSVQIAFARLGLDWLNARFISAHKDDPIIDTDMLKCADKIAVLGGREESLQWIADFGSRLPGNWQAVVFEDLTLKSERIRTVGLDELCELQTSSLTVVLLLKEPSLP